MGETTGLVPRCLKLGIVVGLTVGAVAAAPAAAQEPAICGQYEGLPQCVADQGDVAGEEGSGSADPSGPRTDSESGSGSAPAGDPGGGGGPGGFAAGAGAAGGIASAGGELPFTGYPVTPLIWLLLALLTAGLCVRAYLTLRDRVRARAERGIV